jgi:hypothetical protein
MPTPPPPNEATTCHWIIYPLLQAIGYANRDIVSQQTDNNSQYPDYEILPNTAHTWFLEAKAWKVTLQDTHAQQALNYANNNGRRWVVLTNGQVWRLYDNSIKDAVAAEKLVAEARLEETEAIQAFLRAIGKTSVCAGDLERYAVGAGLTAVLNAQLQDANSEIIRALTRTLRNQPGLSSVTAADVIAYFRAVVSPAEYQQSVIASSPIASPLSVPTISESSIKEYSLGFLAANALEYATGKKPQLVILPDDTTDRVSDWIDVVEKTVLWVAQRQSIPLPFQGRTRGKLYYLNSSPDHQSSRMRKYQEIKTAHQTMYLDTWRSAEDLLKCLCKLCQALAVNVSEIKIQLRSGIARGERDST